MPNSSESVIVDLSLVNNQMLKRPRWLVSRLKRYKNYTRAELEFELVRLEARDKVSCKMIIVLLFLASVGIGFIFMQQLSDYLFYQTTIDFTKYSIEFQRLSEIMTVSLAVFQFVTLHIVLWVRESRRRNLVAALQQIIRN